MKRIVISLTFLTLTPAFALAETTEIDRELLNLEMKKYTVCSGLNLSVAELQTDGYLKDMPNACGMTPQEIAAATKIIKDTAAKKSDKSEKARWLSFHKKITIARAQATWGEGETYGHYKKRLDQTLTDLHQAKLEVELGL